MATKSLRDYDLSLLSAYDLIDVLAENFPPVNPTPGITPDSFWYENGKRGLVEFLVKLKEREQNG